ncbi:hypothetical protein HOY80DRAFT_279959 [Tuber brumale]|nr:hypothetical protein HOY80DRAFT_279959 [Tuber brumale]
MHPTFFFFFLFLSCSTWRILNPHAQYQSTLRGGGRQKPTLSFIICTKGQEKPQCVGGGEIDRQGWVDGGCVVGTKIASVTDQRFWLKSVIQTQHARGCKCGPKYSLTMRAFAPELPSISMAGLGLIFFFY